MKRKQLTCIVILLSTLFFFTAAGIFAGEKSASSSDLPVKWGELTAPDFIKAVEKSGGVCLIPIGVFEKHGPHLPLRTDLIDVREIALRAAKKEYVLVFPEYYFSQILEAKHQPGTIAYSPKLIWDILQETCEEISRNGIKKIILVNGHGGNRNFLPFFGMAQLEKQRDYCVVLFEPETSTEVAEKVKKLKESKNGGHAGETETSTMLVSRPDLVHKDRAKDQSGEDQARLKHIPTNFTGIFWYAQYPNHYAGDGSYAKPELGELLINAQVDQLADLIKILKKDDTILKLQNRFYNESKNPLKTKQ
ncbi:MAG TPA: creatininase family protein [Sedimentisphaerales bacterium]|nr:creatininase family protein [Sedimentisphaerales bacterium]